MAPVKSVIIVGAGPTGLLLALLLAKKGIPVRILDLSDHLDDNPRATHYGSAAAYELQRAGVLDEIRRAGIDARSAAFRKVDGTKMTSIDMTIFKSDPYRLVVLPLNSLSQILFRHFKAQEAASVEWNTKVIGIGQDGDKAWVEVQKLEGTSATISADYVIGCDGANSQVRRSLFGEWNWSGFTWDRQLVAMNVYYDLDITDSYDDINFIVHPQYGHMAAKMNKDGMWRVTYSEEESLTMDEIRARQPIVWQEMFPSKPTPDRYQIHNLRPYKAHQRIVDSMRVGRFLLAGDAAHICSPFGGLGITGGLCDAGGLYDCLAGLHDGKADDSILDTYSKIRREKFIQLVNPISTANFKRLFNPDPQEVAEKDPFILSCKKAETDVEWSRKMQKNLNTLRHDFTKNYLKL